MPPHGGGMEIEMIKGAIFDVDGTLLDTMPIWHEVSGRYLAKRGIKAPQSLVDKIFTMTLSEGCRYIKELYSLPDPTESVEEAIVSEIREFYYTEAQMKPGAGELLRRFSALGIPMVILTSGLRETHTRAMERLGILGCFEELYFCSELGMTKREPETFLRVAEALGTAPCDTCVFEDSLYAIKTAKKAGFQVTGVADADQEKEREEIISLSDLFVYDLTGAYELLDGRNGK